MAVSCLYFFNSNHLLPPSSPHSSLPNFFNREALAKTRSRRSRGGRDSSNVCLLAVYSQSNPKVLKSNRKNRFGEPISPYDSDDEDSEDEDDEEEGSDNDLWCDDKTSEMDEFDSDIQGPFSKKKTKPEKAGYRPMKREYRERSSRVVESVNLTDHQLGVENGVETLDKRSLGDAYHASDRLQGRGSTGKRKTRRSAESRFSQLSEELELDEKWFPLLDYLTTFGLKESHFIQIYERHMSSLQINVTSAKERLEFLLNVGVKHKDIRRILIRQPQILGYTVENNLKSHIAFLVDLGVPHSRLGHIITAAPSLFSYSVEQSLKPTVRYLIEEVGIKRNDVSKVVQLSPQILVQRIDSSWNTRLGFLTKELGAPRDSIVKMVKKHPQLLHYSIEDGILPRINFLRSIGMRNSEILKVLTSLTQVLSLSLEDNLKPKYLYLVNDLRNEVQSLTKYPTYLSLSLDQRIRPRHRFLVYLKKAPKGPFPLSSFIPTDECFCQQWSGTSLDTYLAFRQKLLLKDFANKYGKKR